jgi:hypothetical protein
LSLRRIGCGDRDNLITGSWNLHQGLVDAKIDHVWYIDTGDHGSPVGNSNLYLSSKMLFKPVGSVTSPPSIGNYTVGPGSFIALLRSAGPGFFENALVTKKIELPKNWDKLVAKYKDLEPNYERY